MTTSGSPTAASPQVPDWLPLIVVSVLAAALQWYATAWGVGVSPDSAEYIAAARRLHSGSDLFNLPTQWAPGYPVLLALFYSTGIDIFAMTRVVQCLLFAGNVAAAMFLLRQLLPAKSHEQATLPLAGGAVLLLSFNLWQVNFYAWSEGPFLLCNQSSALLLLLWMQRGGARSLIAAAVLAALGVLFRYAGVAWVGAAGLAILLLSPGAIQQRLRNALLFGAISTVPFVLWLVLNKIVRDETTNRQLVVHLVNTADMKDLLLQFGSWLGLAQSVILFAVELALAVAVYGLALRRFAAALAPLRNLVLLSLIYVVVYTVFILFSKSFIDAYIPLDDRIFVPAWLFAMLGLLACAQHLLLTSPAQWPHRISIAALVVFGLFGMGRLAPMVAIANESGIGYLGAYMSSLSKVTDVVELNDKVVYTNAPDYLRMSTDFNVRDYPRKFMPTTQLANPEYAMEMQSMRNSVRDGTALLVHYPDLEWRKYFPTGAELNDLGFKVLLNGKGVAVFNSPVDTPANQ